MNIIAKARFDAIMRNDKQARILARRKYIIQLRRDQRKVHELKDRIRSIILGKKL